MKTISELRKAYPSLSLKKICETLGLCYQYVLKASKQPKAGEVYDPINGFNDEAVNAILERKNIDLSSCDYDWNTIAAECAAARSSRNDSAAISDFEIGKLFTLRNTREDVVYKVIYKSETHVVFVACDALTSATLENRLEFINVPRVMNYGTFLHQSPRFYGTSAEAAEA